MKNKNHKKVPKQDEDTSNLQILLHLKSLFRPHVIAFATWLHTRFILNNSSQNRDIKCNKICKLPVSFSCLGTFYDSYSSFLNYFIYFLELLCPVMNLL